MRGTSAITGSVIAHAIALAALLSFRVAPPPCVREVPLPVEIELTARPHARPGTRPAATPSSAPSQRAPHAGRPIATEAPPGDDGIVAPSAAASPSRGPIDLFPRAALDRAAGTIVDARPPRGSREAETAKRRIDGWLEDARAADRATKGAIDPAFRVLERELATTFHPPKHVVKSGSWGGTLLRSFFAGPDRLRSPAPSPIDGAVEPRDAWSGQPAGANLRDQAVQQTKATIGALGQPTSWLEVEIDVELHADGRAEPPRIVRSSGLRRFDRYALEEVERMLRARVYEVPEAAQLGFLLRGAYVAKFPLELGGTFDENAIFDRRRRGIRVDNPVERVESEVRLIRFRPLGPDGAGGPPR